MRININNYLVFDFFTSPVLSFVGANFIPSGDGGSPTLIRLEPHVGVLLSGGRGDPSGDRGFGGSALPG